MSTQEEKDEDYWGRVLNTNPSFWYWNHTEFMDDRSATRSAEPYQHLVSEEVTRLKS